METLQILNLKVLNVTNHELLDIFKSGVLVPVNTDVVMKVQKDEHFRKLIKMNSDCLFVMDSQVIRILHFLFFQKTFKAKISGSDFLPMFCQYHRNNPEIKIFLLGAAPGVAALAQKNLNNKAGRKVVVGNLSPSFGFEGNQVECERIIEEINSSNATVLAVGLGCPKQEKWILNHRDRLPKVKMSIAVGATLDFQAGAVKRAPDWISKIGLEWAFRFAMEPKRLYRRYFVENFPFIWHIFRQRLGFHSKSL